MKILREQDVLQGDSCGFEARGDSDAEVVDQMMEHIRDSHPDSELGQQLQRAEQAEGEGLQQETQVEERLRGMVKNDGGEGNQGSQAA